MDQTDLILQKDFQSTEIYVKLRNLVSDTVVDSNRKVIGDVPMGAASGSNSIQLLEIFPNGMTLSIPGRTCAVGHQLELDLHVSHLGKHPFDLHLLARVKELEKASESQDRITVELKSSSEAAWKEFRGLFLARQESITEFIKNARGY